MPIPDLDFYDAKQLSQYHRNHESLTYRCGTLLVVALLVGSVALVIFLSCVIYAHSTHQKLYLKAAIPTLASFIATLPFVIYGSKKEIQHRESKKRLIDSMKDHLLPHYKTTSKKELKRFIEKNLLQDWESFSQAGITLVNEHYKEWHRTYKGYLITQLKEAFKNKEENKLLLEALGELEQGLTKELETLGGEDPS